MCSEGVTEPDVGSDGERATAALQEVTFDESAKGDHRIGAGLLVEVELGIGDSGLVSEQVAKSE